MEACQKTVQLCLLWDLKLQRAISKDRISLLSRASVHTVCWPHLLEMVNTDPDKLQVTFATGSASYRLLALSISTSQAADTQLPEMMLKIHHCLCPGSLQLPEGLPCSSSRIAALLQYTQGELAAGCAGIQWGFAAAAILMRASTATWAACWAGERTPWHYTALGVQGVASCLIRGTNKVGGKTEVSSRGATLSGGDSPSSSSSTHMVWSEEH